MSTGPTSGVKVLAALAPLVICTMSGTAAEPAAATLRLRANPAFAACLRPALAAFSLESGTAAEVEVGDPDPPGNADVVVGDDSEMTGLLEGGAADLATSFDLGYLPWVSVVPAGTPEGALAALAPGRVLVLGGRAGSEARASLKGSLAGRLHVSLREDELRAAPYALVPRSLAGPGEHRPAAVRPLVATVARVAASGRGAEARRLLAFLRADGARRLLAACLDAEAARSSPSSGASSATAVSYARTVVDWWLPQCSLDRNRYNDSERVLGAPDAVNLGGKDQYRGIMSLGEGGYVTVDMGEPVVDRAGADIRVFQATSGEPVSLYAATSAGGPFVLVGLRERCGVRTPGVFSNHCDFDLRAAGLGQARYFKVEDGEIYPCLAAGTVSEGADIDAVQALNQP